MDATSAHACRNCGAALQGHYCHACGQPRVIPERAVDAAGEAFVFLTHWDGRFWRTARLLFSRPGVLSREWAGGRRMTYMPPFQMLLISTLIFTAAAVFALAVHHGVNLNGRGPVQTQGHLGALVQRMALVVVPSLLIGLDAATPRRTLYTHGAVIFYTMSFVLLSGAGLVALAPTGTTLMLMPLLVPALLLHVLLHLRDAYELSWLQAVVRTAAFVAVSFIAFSLLSIVAMMTIWEWMPLHDVNEPLPTFQPVRPG